MALEDHNDIVALETVTSRNQTVAEQSESFEDGNDNGHDHGQDAGPDLPPIDRGRAAWRMLFSAFIFESLLWGEFKILTYNNRREVLDPSVQ